MSREWVTIPDLLVALILVGAFTGLIAKVLLNRPEKPEAMAVEQVLPGSIFLVGIVVGVVGFLVYRKGNLREIFGFDRLGVAPTAGWAGLLLLAGIPFVAAANVFTVQMLKDEAAPQPLVQLFRELVVANEFGGIGTIAFAAVVLAPLCEETLFRGFFYPVGKRYAGTWFSALATSLLFAAFHGNLAALPGLFVLALCLTVAYERTGSIFVPIGMHALFNATSLCVLYLQAAGKLPA